MNNKPKISIILPCRNEEKTLDFCLNQIKETIKNNNLSAEIIVSDSSTDKSPQIAKKQKVILVKHDKEGYGTAYLEAFKVAKGKYIFMADADATYGFDEMPNLLKYLEEGYDMVMGNRLAGNIEEGAMPWKNRHIGTPILSLILKIFFGSKIVDSQSGMRAIKKSSLEKLKLQTRGMEFASEMIVKALKNNFKIKEVPVNYYKRKGESKLKPFSDAWKHIRFMLLYSPLFLFFIPGLIIFSLGIISLFLYPYHMFLSSLMVITGYQLIIFSAFAKIYSITHLNEKNADMEKLFKYVTIEKASLLGALAMIIGLVIANPIITLTFLTIGVQTIFSSFMLSILGIKER